MNPDKNEELEALLNEAEEQSDDLATKAVEKVMAEHHKPAVKDPLTAKQKRARAKAKAARKSRKKNRKK